MWLALLLNLLFHTRLGWLPLGGRLSPGVTPPPHITGLLTVDSLLTLHFGDFVDAVAHLVLPVTTLALGVYGLMVRIARTRITCGRLRRRGSAGGGCFAGMYCATRCSRR